MDNATFDRLARMLAGGASRRHTLRAIIAAALAGGTADELLAKKDRDKSRRDNKKDDKDTKERGRDDRRNGPGSANRVSAQGKKNDNKNKRKRKNKRKPNTNGGGGNSCAGTPLRPGQNFVGCDYSEANLRGRDLNSSVFKDVDLTDADLCGANLESTSFTDSDASGANFTDVNFDSSSHDNTSYANANLTNATFRVATFNEVDFSNADLTGVDFTGSTLSDVVFSGAIFCRTTRPDGSIDNRDCDICDNTCGLCEDCDDEDCTPPDCCPNPSGPGGICVDTETDPLNCGSCDRACFTNLSNACVDGECVCGNDPECSGNQTCCRGEGGGQTRCVNTNTDFDNCGSCGNDCPPSKADQCVGGDCVCGNSPDACGLDLTCCNGDCVDTDDDFDNCGDCGADCSPNKADACTNGVCTCGGGPACTGGLTCCNGQCVDTTSSPGNCGGCDQLCAAISSPCAEVQCIASQCTAVSDPEFTPCLDGQTEGICCGGGAAAICVANGVCCSDTDCGPGETCCSGQCVDTSSSFGNCGGCGLLCAGFAGPCIAGAACIGGQCLPVASTPGTACQLNQEAGICCAESNAVICEVGGVCCDNTDCADNPDGDSCCANQCVDTRIDIDNCGACGNSCDRAKADGCLNGGCICGFNPQCSESETCCSDACVDTETDFENCGACGDACLANADTCADGECVCGTSSSACPEGDVCCEGACLTPGPGVCCGIADCPSQACQILDGCTNNICDYTPQADGTFCGFGGACLNGECVGQAE